MLSRHLWNTEQHDRETRDDRSIFLILCAVYGLAYLPLTTRDIYYIDDMYRLLRGNLEWWVGGRPLADVVFWFVSLGAPALDLAPLTQIAAVPMVAGASVYASRALPRSPALLTALALAPLGLQPYWLENISYRFDSLGMALSLLCATAPWGLRLAGLPQVAAVAVLSLISLNTYQPSFNVFGVLLAYRLVASMMRPDEKRELAATVRIGLGGVLGLAIYTPLAMAQLPENDYVLRHSTLAAVADLPTVIATNLVTSLGTIASEWARTGLGALCASVAVLGSIAAMWATAMRAQRASETAGWRITRTAAAALAVPASFCATQAIQLPLISPVWQARTFVGVGAALAVAGALFSAHGPRRPMMLLLSVQAAAMVSFCFVYANYMAEQNRFDRHVSERIVADIELLRLRAPVSAINFDGRSGYSPAVLIATDKYPILRKLIPLYLRERWGFGITLMNLLGLDVTKGTLPPSVVQQTVCSSKPASANARYTIYLHQTTAIVRFAATAAPCPQ